MDKDHHHVHPKDCGCYDLVCRQLADVISEDVIGSLDFKMITNFRDTYNDRLTEYSIDLLNYYIQRGQRHTVLQKHVTSNTTWEANTRQNGKQKNINGHIDNQGGEPLVQLPKLNSPHNQQ